MAASLAVSSIGLLAGLGYVAWTPVMDRVRVLGMMRSLDSITNVHGVEPVKVIADTLQCEDLAYHDPSGLIFAGCQTGDREDRRHWFPPLLIWDSDKYARGGSLVVIDPKTFKATHLKLKDFKPKAFVTHGIDIHWDPETPDDLTIFAVNHLPNPLHWDAATSDTASPHKAWSQIEQFSHKIGSSEAKHLRSIRDPAIYTPNDIFAASESAFYVTNDHYYREGYLRMFEDLADQRFAPWADTQYVEITNAAQDLGNGIEVTRALKGIHNNNGLAHASRKHRPHELLVADATGGVLVRMLRNLTVDVQHTPNLKGLEPFFFNCSIDNPSFYEDPYATPDNNATGYLVAGLARGFALNKEFHAPGGRNPVQAWHVRVNTDDPTPTHAHWETRLVFQDDGRTLDTASAAVMVPIDPKHNAGKKQAWLFVTGFGSDNVVAAKIDL